MNGVLTLVGLVLVGVLLVALVVAAAVNEWGRGEIVAAWVALTLAVIAWDRFVIAPTRRDR